VLVQHFIKVRAVVLAGGAGGDLADELVPDVHADAQLVAVVALAVFLGVRGIQILLPRLAALQSLGTWPCSSWALSSW
jgi:hypothetical protein